MQLVRNILFAASILFIASETALAQPDPKFSGKNWQLKDFGKDSVFGVSADRAYAELLKGKKSKPVIVAVLDGGVDTAQEDLQGHIWTNPKEIPGNGIDDDHNGYVDDMHGWNFLGNKNDSNLTAESYEATREYFRLRPKYGPMPDSAAGATAEGKYWLRVKTQIVRDSMEAVQTVFMVARVVDDLESKVQVLEKALHRDTVTMNNLDTLQTTDSATLAAQKLAGMYARNFRLGDDQPFEGLIEEGRQYVNTQRNKLESLRVDPNARRRAIVGDDFNNIDDRNYGNPNVSAGEPSHGTHVSGIIAAIRGNGLGLDGIADNVQIMAVRVTPDGDERDKDVALGIRYAVDNGARIINMSFGKYFSPQKDFVDDAVKYAEDHDVLLIHAAGNEAFDIDTVENFPNPDLRKAGRKAATFINIGASGGGPDSLVVAPFSNYGKTEVDLFAPGVNIYSTVPHNRYATYSGTSMAAPTTTGVAALVLEYYPKLSARQLRQVLEQSTMKLPDPQVRLAATHSTVDFASLSATGGIVNAYNALKLAATMKGERKK